MGFETQEEAERWAEEIEFRADAAKEEKLLASANEPAFTPSREVLARRMGNVHPDERTSSVIVAAIKTSSLTVNEMGNILGAITDRICACAYGKYPEYPELETIAGDLAETCEEFSAAQDRIDERKCNQEASDIEEGDWK